MQLKSLTMTGFKSFADKTSVVFQPGITAVVGPNGCGKSNISDGIRWVLGEQSAKHLRGDKMEDVIFNGTESRKPTGMAEVTLTLTDMAGQLPPGFGDYNEIEITRRLFRSGESEYHINKIPCRLKDIRDLMMDAGVGAKVHAIIEQDRVDQILSSKPQDRRFLFEEAAGVMKYKARRQEALSKLESTQQNQVRVNDILSEVKRQVNSLDRQAKKAERYQKLRSEMKDLDYRLSAVEYSNLGLGWNAATEEFRSLENGSTELHASLSKAESAIEEARADALAAERELTTLQNRIHETESALARAEHRVEMSKSQIASLTDQRARDLADREYLTQEIARVAEARSRGAEEQRTMASAMEEKNGRLKQRTTVIEGLAENLRSKEQQLEETRAGVYSAVTESAAEHSRITTFQARLSQLDEESERGRKETGELEQRLQESTLALQTRERELAEIAERGDALQEERRSIIARIEETTANKKTAETNLGEAKDRLSDRNSRLRSLLELEQSLEGYQKGVQTVMSARKENGNGERLGKIHGLVADMLETEPRYEAAIEAVLGDRLQYVVVDSQTDSLKAIDFLKSKSGGRSTFVPRSPREIKTEAFVKNGHSGVIGPALQVVRCKDNFNDLAQYLLGDVVVVDTMQTALHLWEHNGFHKTLVTLDGEIVDPWGAVTGGTTADAGGRGILAKRREIKDLEQETAALSRRVEELVAGVRELERSHDDNKAREAELSREIHQTEIELVNREKDAASLRDETARTSQRVAALADEAAGRAERRTELAASIERSTVLLQGLEDGKSSAQAAIESLQKDLTDQKESLESARAEITELRMAVASLQEKQDAAAANAAQLEHSGRELQNRLDGREKELADIVVKLQESEKAITEAEAEIKDRIVVRDADREVLVARQEAYRESADGLRGIEEQAKEVRHDIEAAQKRLSANEVKRTELRMKIEHLKDAIWTGYHVELEAVVRELGQFELNVDEAKARVDELRQKIDQMGPINVDALQEYADLKERHDLLSAQQQDITESMENLRKTIAKLDGETRELFLEAYNAIHEKFKEVFSLLFEGGKAELVLLDEANILESGIEIVAQPRGKKFQSITLLSGGERALTAIALLFAAFLVKPSPFCMLDEVDAPLDESNVTRFTRLLREMSSRSQFILITHNKRTMETADALYGITMEEPGCSRIMSVKLREAVMA
ncbi:MAG: chromosome segregation protein SMC [Nitrospirae bacterium GWC2_57_13]|jgi:chromosome segregation protein|nr:MAG: chromosome segregation protein SMC [Nitrospirae bacterium GWC2_57_13]